MSTISANELKVKGIASIEDSLQDNNEVVISVRGKDRYVVMDMDHYHYLRECELEAALIQTQEDLKAGHFVVESPEEHVARLESSV